MRAARRARPGSEPDALVLGDGADAPGCPERSVRLGRRSRSQHRLAVLVEVRPEPRTCVVVRVGQHAARTQLAHARAACRGGYEAVSAAHELGAPVEHVGAGKARVAEARGVDRLQVRAAGEHLVGVGYAGQVLEARDLGAVGEGVEPVRAVGDAHASNRRVDVDLAHQELDGVPQTSRCRGVAVDVHLEDLLDRPAVYGAPPVVVVELERAVREQQRPHLVSHVPLKSQDRRRHVTRLVLRGKPVLAAYRVGDVLEDVLREHARFQLHVRLSLVLPGVGAVQGGNSSRHLPGLVGCCHARLVADSVGDVREDMRGDRSDSHQKLTSERSSRLAIAALICCVTHACVA